jgi:hypothetical protein
MATVWNFEVISHKFNVCSIVYTWATDSSKEKETNINNNNNNNNNKTTTVPDLQEIYATGKQTQWAPLGTPCFRALNPLTVHKALYAIGTQQQKCGTPSHRKRELANGTREHKALLSELISKLFITSTVSFKKCLDEVSFLRFHLNQLALFQSDGNKQRAPLQGGGGGTHRLSASFLQVPLGSDSVQRSSIHWRLTFFP